MRGISSRPRAAAPTEGLSQTVRNLKSAAFAADFFIADLVVHRRYVPNLSAQAAMYDNVPTRGALVLRSKPSEPMVRSPPLIRAIGVCVVRAIGHELPVL